MMNQKKKRYILMTLTLIILLVGMLHKDVVMTVCAEAGNTFSIEAEILPSNKETYDVSITVENQGEDWEGTARLTIAENYLKPVAYDTAISLPQGSKKNFVVKIPVNSINNADGTVTLTLLDKKNKEAAVKEYERLLKNQADSLSMGILSDTYSDLTYMDMGGNEIYFFNSVYPIRLVELQQGNLENVLDSLAFLVIDHYNTGILSEEELEAIERWNLKGGVLIIGTGEYAKDTLSGFDGGYLGISFDEIDDASEDKFGYATGSYVDWSQLTMARLYGTDGMDVNYYTNAFVTSMGSGSVCVLPYSLAKLGKIDDFSQDSNQEIFVMQMLESASDFSSMRYSSPTSYYDDGNWYIQRMLRAVGNSNSILNFGVLKAIVIIYVIFVGPVLYLILRSVKRRELYWVAVPVTALLVIVLIFFAGRGFEVVSTRVYSVTIENLADSGESITYFNCYDAGRGEWKLRLHEGCEYAGPTGYDYYNGLDEKSYYYHITKDGDRFSIGIKPSSNFEDSYFYAKSSQNKNAAQGSLSAQDMSIEFDNINGDMSFKGTLVNDTNLDMDYFALIWHDSLYIYENLPAKASFSLNNVEPVYVSSGYNYSSYTYDFLEDFYDDGEYEKAGILSALGVGLYNVYPQLEPNNFMVIGVVEDWEKAIDDNCSEMSYGCFYSILQ